MNVAWKVLTAPQMAALLADGSFGGAPVDVADGYIHLSTEQQLAETLAKHFAGQNDLYLAAVDLDALSDAIRWEPSRGGQLFPHLYGKLPIAAVPAHAPLTHAADGAPILPHLDPPPLGEVAARNADGGVAQAQPSRAEFFARQIPFGLATRTTSPNAGGFAKDRYARCGDQSPFACGPANPGR